MEAVDQESVKSVHCLVQLQLEPCIQVLLISGHRLVQLQLEPVFRYF